MTITEDQTQLRDTIRRFVRERTPMSRVRATIADNQPYDPDIWRVLGLEFGLAGLVLPEELGGVGAIEHHKDSEIPGRNVRHVDRLPTYADLWRLDR